MSKEKNNEDKEMKKLDILNYESINLIDNSSIQSDLKIWGFQKNKKLLREIKKMKMVRK